MDNVIIDEELFIGLMVGDIRKSILLKTKKVDGVARMFCRMMNNLHNGVPVIVELTFDKYSTMNFTGCKVTQIGGNEFKIKHKTGHVGFYGKTCTIWFGKGYNRIELKPKNIRWSCVKTSTEDLPVGYHDVLKIKFAHIGARNVRNLCKIYKMYRSEYIKALA